MNLFRYFYSRRSNVTFLALLFIAVTSIFIHTYIDRRDYIGSLGGEHSWLAAHTTLITRHWFREGGFNLKFLMVNSPYSIESPSIPERDIYSSYPPGSSIPIYLASKILSKEPSISLVNQINLLNHYLISIVLTFGLGALFFLAKIPFKLAFIFGFVPAAAYLFWPASMYWHTNSYFSDQAVILPFALAIILESLFAEKIALFNRRKSLLFDIVQFIIIFWGVYTDWLFIPLVFWVIYSRIFISKSLSFNLSKQNIHSWLKIISPGALALGIYIIPIIQTTGLTPLFQKFLFRAGISAEGASYVNGWRGFYNGFFRVHIWNQLGKIGLPIITFSLLTAMILVAWTTLNYFNRARKIKLPHCLLILFTVPAMSMLTQLLILRNHSVIHSFSALKFILLFFIFLISVLAVSYLSIIRLKILDKIDPQRTYLSLITALIALFGLFTSGIKHQNFLEYFSKDFNFEFPLFVAQNSSFKDIFVSSSLEIPVFPPHQLAISMKHVHKFKTFNEAENFVNKHNGNLVIIEPVIAQNLCTWCDEANKKYKSKSEVLYSNNKHYLIWRQN